MKLQTTGYIVIKRKRRGMRQMVLHRLTKTKPGLAADEIAVKISLSMDSKVFEKLVPEVNIDIKERHILVSEIDGKVVQEKEK